MTMIIEEYQEYTQKLIDMQKSLSGFQSRIAETELMLANYQHKLDLIKVLEREAQILTPHEN